MDKVRLVRILYDLMKKLEDVRRNIEKVGAITDSQVLKIVINNLGVIINELSREK